MASRAAPTRQPNRWRELIAPWSCLAAVLLLAGILWPAIMLATLALADGVASSRLPADARAWAARRRAAWALARRGVEGASGCGACLLHDLLDDDMLRNLLAHLDARALEAVACVDTRMCRLGRDESVWRRVFAARFGGAGGAVLGAMPDESLQHVPASPPFGALLAAASRLRPSPRWWGPNAPRAPPSVAAPADTTAAAVAHGAGGEARAGPSGADVADEPLDPELAAAAARVAALGAADERAPCADAAEAQPAEAEAGRHCAWRVYYYLFGLLWRRLAVSAHRTAEDCWMVVDEHVCDVSSTGFLSAHPGEAGPLLLFGGLDASAAFHATGHSFAGRYFGRLQVGGLAMPAEGRPALVQCAWAADAPAPAAPLSPGAAALEATAAAGARRHAKRRGARVGEATAAAAAAAVGSLGAGGRIRARARDAIAHPDAESPSPPASEASPGADDGPTSPGGAEAGSAAALSAAAGTVLALRASASGAPGRQLGARAAQSSARGVSGAAAHTPSLPGPRLLARALRLCASAAAPLGSAGLMGMAWGDEPRQRHLSYHDFLALRAAG